MPEFEGQQFSVPSQGSTRGPNSDSLSAKEVYERIKERQSGEIAISANDQIAALTERVDELEKRLAQRNRIQIPAFLRSIPDQIAAVRDVDWKEAARINAPAIGSAIGFSAAVLLGELQIAGVVDLNLIQPGASQEAANAFRFLNATNIGLITMLTGNAAGVIAADYKLARRRLLGR